MFAVEYSLNGVYDVLECLDMVCISAPGESRSRSGGAGGIQINFARKVQAVLPPNIQSEQVDIWFQTMKCA